MVMPNESVSVRSREGLQKELLTSYQIAGKPLQVVQVNP